MIKLTATKSKNGIRLFIHENPPRANALELFIHTDDFNNFQENLPEILERLEDYLNKYYTRNDTKNDTDRTYRRGMRAI